MKIETWTIEIDRPFKVYVGQGWDDSDPRVEIQVTKVEIDKNTPEQLEALLGCRVVEALLDLGLARKQMVSEQ